jgi:hypothetical protein
MSGAELPGKSCTAALAAWSVQGIAHFVSPERGVYLDEL